MIFKNKFKLTSEEIPLLINPSGQKQLRPGDSGDKRHRALW